MDFAPVKKGAVKGPGVRSVAKPEMKPVARAVARPVAKPGMKPVVKPVAKVSPVVKKEPTARKEPLMEREPALGVIEDLGAVKSEEVKPVETKKPGTKPADKIFKMPKPKFINQDKIIKRPLSKNVYRKKVVAPKEEPKGPVTIITKPESQAHVSLIITVIIFRISWKIILNLILNPNII